MHRTLLKHKDEIIAYLNKKILEDIADDDLEDVVEALEGMCYIADIVETDHDIKMDHHEMAMKSSNPMHGNPMPHGNPVHTGNPTKAASHPTNVQEMSTIDGPHTHGIASFTLGNM